MIEEFHVKNVERIGVIADTHIPARAKELPAEVYDVFQDVDLIIHAGDVVEMNVIHDLRGIAEVIAVHGNMCNADVQEEFPYKCVIHVNGFKIGVVHGHGPVDRDTIKEHAFQEFKCENAAVDCIIFGHTHHPENEVIDGILFFNPGSAVDNQTLAEDTVGILTVGHKSSGGIIKGEIISIGKKQGKQGDDNEF